MDSVVYLSPAVLHYRIPVFEEMARRWPGGFRVVALRNPRGREEQRVIGTGAFERTLVGGRWVPLSYGYLRGEATPTGILLAPGVVPVLFRTRPRTVIVNNFSAWTIVAQIARTWGARIVICWEGTLHTERTVGKGRRLLRQWLAENADAFVVNGKLSREYIEGLGVAREKIVEGAMGVNVEQIATASCAVPECWVASKREELGLRGTVFLTVSRLILGKGISCLLSALALMRARDAEASLLVVGDGPERASLEAQAKRDGLAGVHFIGWVPAEQVPAYHRLADLFVLPTLQDNWSLAVLEAMASGLPIVTTVYNGLWPELVREGENGCVVTPENVVEFASRLTEMCAQSRERIREMGARSRELVQGYRPDRVAAAFVEAVRIAGRG